MAGEKASTLPRRKTALNNKHGKEVLSDTKDKLIVEIPLVRRIRDVVVQPQAIVVPFQAEDVRIAIPVSEYMTNQPYHCSRNLQIGRRR